LPHKNRKKTAPSGALAEEKQGPEAYSYDEISGLTGKSCPWSRFHSPKNWETFIPTSIVILSIPPPSITLEIQLHETIVPDYTMVNDFLTTMLSDGLVTPLTAIPSDIVLQFDLQPSFERHPDFGITFCS
jgi:hypothetical protein